MGQIGDEIGTAAVHATAMYAVVTRTVAKESLVAGRIRKSNSEEENLTILQEDTARLHGPNQAERRNPRIKNWR